MGSGEDEKEGSDQGGDTKEERDEMRTASLGASPLQLHAATSLSARSHHYYPPLSGSLCNRETGVDSKDEKHDTLSEEILEKSFAVERW